MLKSDEYNENGRHRLRQNGLKVSLSCFVARILILQREYKRAAIYYQELIEFLTSI